MQIRHYASLPTLLADRNGMLLYRASSLACGVVQARQHSPGQQRTALLLAGTQSRSTTFCPLRAGEPLFVTRQRPAERKTDVSRNQHLQSRGTWTSHGAVH